jgi:hypothetical protein
MSAALTPCTRNSCMFVDMPTSFVSEVLKGVLIMMHRSQTLTTTRNRISSIAEVARSSAVQAGQARPSASITQPKRKSIVPSPIATPITGTSQPAGIWLPHLARLGRIQPKRTAALYQPS